MRLVVGGLVLLGMLALTGCVDGDRIPTLPPTPTSTPIFASEEEALAAAEEAYAAYLEMSSLIAHEGGSDPERIASFVTDDHLSEELEGLSYYSDNALHADGALGFDSMRIQQVEALPTYTEIRVYVCADATDTRLLNSEGVDVTPADRPLRVPFEVAFYAASPDSVLLNESSVWTGDDFC